MFTDFLGRTTGRTEKLSGSLKTTSLPGVAPLIIPVIGEFHQMYSEIDLEFIADEQLARLEYGEAHVAIRAGAKPTTPDYVVLPFRQVRFGLYARGGYVQKNGKPTSGKLSGHKFVGPHGNNSPFPYTDWMCSEIPGESFVLRSSDQQVITAAVKQDLGLGFVAEIELHNPKRREFIPPKDTWSVTLWLVTHADLRRTLKVQEFLRFARM